jgi:hypothetical protein
MTPTDARRVNATRDFFTDSHSLLAGRALHGIHRVRGAGDIYGKGER